MSVADSPPSIPYAAGPLDRAERLRADQRSLDALLADPRTRFLVFRDLKVAMRKGPPPDLAWLRGEQLPECALADSVVVFLGLDGSGAARFALAADGVRAGWADGLVEGFVDARSAGLQLLDGRAAIVAHGRSVLDWHARHRYCAACGAPNESRHGGAQLRCVDRACGAVHFPRTDPVVIMLVESPDGRRCLLARSRHYPKGLVSALAGYMEPGESIEDAVRREVREEAGIDCTHVRYFASQPWPFPSSLMIGCFARSETWALEVDTGELEWARWFDRDEARWLFDESLDGLHAPQPVAIAHYLLRRWVEGPPGIW